MPFHKKHVRVCQKSFTSLFSLGFHNSFTVLHMRNCIHGPKKYSDFSKITLPGHARNKWMAKSPGLSLVLPKTPIFSQISHRPADLGCMPALSVLLFAENLSISGLINPYIRKLCITALSRATQRRWWQKYVVWTKVIKFWWGSTDSSLAISVKQRNSN